jgi:hypothetical protein
LTVAVFVHAATVPQTCRPGEVRNLQQLVQTHLYGWHWQPQRTLKQVAFTGTAPSRVSEQKVAVLLLLRAAVASLWSMLGQMLSAAGPPHRVVNSFFPE